MVVPDRGTYAMSPGMHAPIRLALALAILIPCLALAQSHGPLGIDNKGSFDDSGIYKHSTLQAIEGLTFFSIVGSGLWQGGESRFGKSSWQSIDSMALGAVASTGLKYVFTRSRPSQTDDPNQWFQGKGHYSFPSGEVTFMSAAVTPYVLEYGRENPWVYALELLPAYTAAQRVKTQAHWQTDVLAGWALGFGTGYLAHEQNSPWILRVMPGGVQVGLKTRF